MHPDVLTDPTRSRLYYYCANAEFLQTDPEVPKSRAAFVLSLRALLGAYINIEQARYGIEARE